MGRNITKAHLRMLKENYEKACNDYLHVLARMWEWDCKSYGFWIGDEVGGIYSYGEQLFINMDNIIYVVENDISYSTYMEWLDYTVWASEFGQSIPNLKSWVSGCPRVDQATQEKLSAMKYELAKLMEETKNKF